MQSRIQTNAQTKPEVVRPALIEGMATLDKIETRVKAQSRNVSHEGIGIDAIHDMYMDYLQSNTALADIAYPMAETIKTVMSTQTLTTSENVRLTNTLTGIIGDVNLAEAYVDGQAAAASPGGGGYPGGNGGYVSGDDVSGDGIRPVDDGRRLIDDGIRPIDEGVVEKVDEEGESGYNDEQVVQVSALDFVPSVKNGEFEKWFNLLSSEEFDRIWSNSELKEKIKDRLRAPGGLHEWHLVSRADIFKRWGITAEEIKEMRTAVEDVRFVNPSGIHGGRGSTKAHNELLEIIDSSNTYAEFKARLQEWAARRLYGGIEALPPGLRD